MSALTIVKIGGNVINNPVKLEGFLNDFSKISGNKILVYGGGREATELSGQIGLETKLIDGRRVTDKATLDLVTMVYAGLINKRIVLQLQNCGCDAVGLTGADGASIPATRRDAVPIDYGYVGDINPANVNTRFIASLMDEATVPVFCAICYEKGGSLLNCNADSVASALAKAFASEADVRLVYCLEKPGVLTDVDDVNSLIPEITAESFSTLVDEGKITGGMIPKVSNALQAVASGVKEVRICEAGNLLSALGTVIR